MLKKLVTIILILIAVLSSPRISYAQYGQDVLGEETEEEEIVHEPVETGVIDQPQHLGFALIGSSGILYLISKKTKEASLKII